MSVVGIPFTGSSLVGKIKLHHKAYNQRLTSCFKLEVLCIKFTK